MNLGTVDLKRLSQKHGDTQFLADLITKEMKRAERPDAVIFAGPKVMLDANVPQDSLKEVGEPSFPVFYMNYNLNPQSNPWRDAIGERGQVLQGHGVHHQPPAGPVLRLERDHVSRIVKSKMGRQIANVSSK